MLKDIEKLLIEGNFQFQSKINKNPEIYSFDQRIPKYPILFLTCMDLRIDVHQIFQLNPGDVFILRNAGNVYTQDMRRSILIAIHKYKIKDIIILGHLDCGMTKMNLNELRKKLPNKFLNRLSLNYSDLLSKLYDFFKPFDNEIRNIIEQINDLQELKAFFSDIEITGMLYDTQTGWIFKSEDFRDLLIKENHFKIYEGLIFEKNQKLSKFLKLNNNNINEASKEVVDKNQDDELNLKEEIDSLKTEERCIISIREDELQKSDDKENIVFQIKMPKIQVPKINIPKLKIYIPNRAKVKDD